MATIDNNRRSAGGLAMLATTFCLLGCQSVDGKANRPAFQPAEQGLPAGGAGSSATAESEVPRDASPVQVTPDLESVDNRSAQDRVLSRLSAHEPLYFAVGFGGRTNAKFQYSLAYSFLNPEGSLVQGTPGLEGIHFGFSQTTIWDLESESAPFLDSTYRPALFWRDKQIDPWSHESLEVGLEAGIEHESNGKDGVDSRSINIAYVKPSWDWTLPGDIHFAIEPKVWAYLSKGNENDDIEDFRGNFNLRLMAFHDDGFGISSDMRLGQDSDHGYLQVDLTYPMRKIFSGDFEGFLFVQYFNGWGESIIAYNQKTPSQVRIGFALIR